jgi:hypothetical protein
MQVLAPMPPMPRPTGRAWCRIGMSGLVVLLLLGGCAQRAPRPGMGEAPVAGALGDAQARQLISQWQRQLADHLSQADGGDPAALARLPGLRATGTLRPGRITFAALDLDASLAERDGFDVQGLLLDPLAEPGPQPYVFVVGIVQRQGYRPLALVDIRLVALSLRAGQPDWSVGDGNPQALARFRAGLAPSLPLRFPADKDRFGLAGCAAGLCADEFNSGAQWSVAVPHGTRARAAFD